MSMALVLISRSPVIGPSEERTAVCGRGRDKAFSRAGF